MALPTTDRFAKQYGGASEPGLSWPASTAVAVTPSNDNDLADGPCRALYIGVAGDVKIDLADTGTAIVFKALPVGFAPLRAKRVYATGTAATDIVALY